MQHFWRIAGPVAVFILVVGYVGWTRLAPSPVPGSSSPDSTRVPLAMLVDPEGTPDRGCDDVMFVDQRIPEGASPLTAALETLFAIPRDSVDGARHFLSQTRETLHFDRAVIEADTVRIYLTGRLTGLRGVCDYPRARIQIEETARRITGHREIALYLNGSRTSLQPDGRGRPRR